MRVQFTWRTLSGLVLGLLLLSTVAMGGCSDNYQGLLGQLQQQAKIMQNTSKLLDPYIRIQGLDKLKHQEFCKERPGAFPGKDDLEKLGMWGFLKTLNVTQNLVLNRLNAFQEKVFDVQDKDQDWKKLDNAQKQIRGIKNNIICLTQLLNDSSGMAAPILSGPRTLPPPTLSPGDFNLKLDGCKFLQGYHRFMHSVWQVLSKQVEVRNRSRRHSPRWAPQGQTHRTRLFRRAKRPRPMGLPPR